MLLTYRAIKIRKILALLREGVGPSWVRAPSSFVSLFASCGDWHSSDKESPPFSSWPILKINMPMEQLPRGRIEQMQHGTDTDEVAVRVLPLITFKFVNTEPLASKVEVFRMACAKTTGAIASCVRPSKSVGIRRSPAVFRP